MYFDDRYGTWSQYCRENPGTGDLDAMWKVKAQTAEYVKKIEKVEKERNKKRSKKNVRKNNKVR